MIVYGWGGRELAGATKADAACHACGKSPLRTAGVVRHFHLFWIPVIPFRRLEVLACPACGATRTGSDVPEPARSEIRRTVFTAGRMLPSFAGAILIAIAVAVTMYTSAARHRTEAEWIAHPAIRDHYVVHVPQAFESKDKDDLAYPYRVMEVAAVEGEVVTLRLANKAWNKESAADKDVSSGAIRSADYFDEATVDLQVVELAKLHERNAIRSVIR